jgi:hypothetical protein
MVIEIDLHILPKATRVIVPDGLRVPKRFQKRIRIQDDALHVFDLLIPSRDLGNVLHDLFCGNRLPGTGFAGNDTTLVNVLALHVSVGLLGKSKNVRGELVPELATVKPNVFSRGEAKIFVRINNNKNGANVCLKSINEVEVKKGRKQKDR